MHRGRVGLYSRTQGHVSWDSRVLVRPMHRYSFVGSGGGVMCCCHAGSVEGGESGAGWDRVTMLEGPLSGLLGLVLVPDGGRMRGVCW